MAKKDKKYKKEEIETEVGDSIYEEDNEEESPFIGLDQIREPSDKEKNTKEIEEEEEITIDTKKTSKKEINNRLSAFTNGILSMIERSRHSGSKSDLEKIISHCNTILDDLPKNSIGIEYTTKIKSLAISINTMSVVENIKKGFKEMEKYTNKLKETL